MEPVLQFIQEHLPALIEHKYLFIFLGVAIEGINSTILAGFLASIGAVAVWPAFLLAIVGQIINAFAWYAVGYFAGSKPIDKWGRKDEKSRKIIEKVEEYFHRYSGRAILFAHLTWSLTIATMITAGSFKYNLKKFAFYNIVGSTVWVVMIFFLGFFFGQSYKFFFEILKNLFLLFAFLGGVIALAYFIKKIFGGIFIRSLFLREHWDKFSHNVKDKIDEIFSEDIEDKRRH
ncbi:MAG: DedA family protein [Candidatus Paceibacterota bacterium]